jgi:ubiquinone/menaquinone biosynthesis C-methylase UbiE
VVATVPATGWRTSGEGGSVSEHTYALHAEAAEFYESTFVPALFREWAVRLVSFAGVEPGQRVLDVACGTGVVARTAADRLTAGLRGPQGEASRAGLAAGDSPVTGLDINEDILAVARRLRPDVRWVPGDAGDLPFPAAAFDVVLCQAALMFFGDRAAALREMGRVVRPQGTIAVQVPGRLSHSPGYVALAVVVARHADADVVDLLNGYFAVGEPDLLHELFGAAGLIVDRFTTWVGATRLDSIDAFLAVELLPVVRSLDEAVRERIVRDCADALRDFVDGTGAIAAPIEVHLIAARPDGGR